MRSQEYIHENRCGQKGMVNYATYMYMHTYIDYISLPVTYVQHVLCAMSI